jgi:hypothetical protein
VDELRLGEDAAERGGHRDRVDHDGRRLSALFERFQALFNRPGQLGRPVGFGRFQRLQAAFYGIVLDDRAVPFEDIGERGTLLDGQQSVRHALHDRGYRGAHVGDRLERRERELDQPGARHRPQAIEQFGGCPAFAGFRRLSPPAPQRR